MSIVGSSSASRGTGGIDPMNRSPPVCDRVADRYCSVSPGSAAVEKAMNASWMALSASVMRASMT